MKSPGAARRARQALPSLGSDLTSVPLRDRKKMRQREALVRISLKLFREKGFENVRVENIAELAEVSKPTVYNYFGRKRDVLVEIVKQDRADNRRLFEAILADPPTEPDEGFAALIQANMNNIRTPEDKRLWREILATIAESHDPEQDPFEDNDDVFRHYIERLLAHYIRTAKLARDLQIDIAVDVLFAVNTQNLRRLTSSEHSSPEKAREKARRLIGFVLARWGAADAC